MSGISFIMVRRNMRVSRVGGDNTWRTFGLWKFGEAYSLKIGGVYDT